MLRARAEMARPMPTGGEARAEHAEQLPRGGAIEVREAEAEGGVEQEALDGGDRKLEEKLAREVGVRADADELFPPVDRLLLHDLLRRIRAAKPEHADVGEKEGELLLGARDPRDQRADDHRLADDQREVPPIRREDRGLPLEQDREGEAPRGRVHCRRRRAGRAVSAPRARRRAAGAFAAGALSIRRADARAAARRGR